MGINSRDSLWTSFSDVERRKIEETLGIRLADYTTSDEKEAVLIEFDQVSRRQAEIQARKDVIDHYFDRQERAAVQQVELEARVLSQRSTQRYLPEPPVHVEVLPIQTLPQYVSDVSQPVTRPQAEVSSPHPASQQRNQHRTIIVREERDTPKPTQYSFIDNVKQYAMVTILTLGGAYVGFSAARHTDLADDLRRMEENPIIKAYQVAHEVEMYQKLREWDFLGPEQKNITERRDSIDSTKKKIGKVAAVIDSLKTLVEDVPLLGRGAALIEQQQQQIRLYEQRQEQYTSNLIQYTTVGTGGGFGIGIFLAFQRRRKA